MISCSTSSINCLFFSWSWTSDSKNLNTLISVWWDAQKGWLCQCNCILEKVYHQATWNFFKKKWIDLPELSEQWSRQVFIRMRTNELVSLFQKNSPWVPSARRCVITGRSQISRTKLLNCKTALIQMQIISLNIPKSARVYNRSLSSLLLTPDPLQQYSAVRV